MIRDMLIKHEGWKKRPYHCPAGKLTIGVGWNIDANYLPDDIASHLREHGEITDEMINRLLTISIEAAIHNCRDIWPGFDNFSENRRDALTDFVFNIGARGVQKFKKANKAIMAGNWETAAKEMRDSAWYHQVGNRSVEIVDMVLKG
jgi:lysozyme